MKDSRDVHDDDDLLDTDAYRPDMDELQKEKEKGHLLLVVQVGPGEFFLCIF